MLPTTEESRISGPDYQGKGFGIAECSHRGNEFDGVLDEAIVPLPQGLHVQLTFPCA